MIKAKMILALAVLVVVSACSASDVPAKAGTGAKYVAKNESYQRVWRATMAAAGRNFSVEHSSEAGGLIRGHASGSEEIGVFVRRSRTNPSDVEIEVAGGKKTGLTITSSFYKSPTAKNWSNIIFKEIQYELENMNRMDAMANAPRPASLRMEDMSPEMRAQAQTNVRSDIRAQIREEVRAQMQREMRMQTQQQGYQPAPQAAPNYQPAQPTQPQAPRVREYTSSVGPTRAPLAPPARVRSQYSAPAQSQYAEPAQAAAPAPAPTVAPPLPKTTLTLRERLRELKKMYQDQLISKPEYEAKKESILGDL